MIAESMSPQQERAKWYAHVAPFAAFMVLTVILQMGAPLIQWEHPTAAWWQQKPEYVIYALQTVLCLGIVIYWRRAIAWDWKPLPSIIGVCMGVIGIAFWILPCMIADRIPGDLHSYFGSPSWPWYQYLLGIDYRADGFNPSAIFADGSSSWWACLIMRFLRAVIAVAFVEELFWRGFLMRFLINDSRPWSVPFGTHSWKAYLITTACFMAIHAPVDYFGAFIYGSLTYLLAVTTKNLCATIIMHGTANLCMGLAAMAWGKDGLW